MGALCFWRLYNRTHVFRSGRISGNILLLLFLCALVSVQTASFASEHSHADSSEHCCILCHAGPLPFVQTVASAVVPPHVIVAWCSGSIESDTPHEVLLAAGSSRAPPALHPVFSI